MPWYLSCDQRRIVFVARIGGRDFRTGRRAGEPDGCHQSGIRRRGTTAGVQRSGLAAAAAATVVRSAGGVPSGTSEEISLAASLCERWPSARTSSRLNDNALLEQPAHRFVVMDAANGVGQ